LKSNHRIYVLKKNYLLVKNELSLEHGYDTIQSLDLEKNQFCVIKLRFEGLESTLVYYTLKSEKIQNLVDTLELVFSCKNGEFIFLSNFPRRKLEFKPEDSFENLGLTPRAALYLKFV